MFNRIFKNSYIRFILLFLLYFLLSSVFYARYVIFHLNSSVIGYEGVDPYQYIWAFRWLGYAINNHLNPFFTDFIWHPYGFSIAWGTSVLGPAFIALPITMVFGPIVSYNLFIIIGNALSGFFDYLLIKEITNSKKAGFLGSLFFAFSTYQITQIVHFNLEIIFCLPLIFYLFVLLWKSKINKWVYIFSLVLTLSFQFTSSLEIFATSVFFTVIFMILYIYYEKPELSKIKMFIQYNIISFILFMLLISPVLFALLNKGLPTRVASYPTIYKIDLANLIIPTDKTLFLSNYFPNVYKVFGGGNRIEEDGYLGIPLILLVITFSIKNWKEAKTKYLSLTLFITTIFSLGSVISIMGKSFIIGPGSLMLILPLMNNALPARFMLFSFFIVSIIVGCWIKDREINKYFKYSLAIVALIFILPSSLIANGNHEYMDISIPTFFKHDTYKQYLKRNDNVLILPYGFYSGEYMLYQEETNMYFKMPEEYLGPESIIDDRVYFDPIANKIKKGNFNTVDINDFKAYIKKYSIDEILIRKDKYNNSKRLLDQLNTSSNDFDGYILIQLNN